MKDCLLLVFANKQDLPGGMSPCRQALFILVLKHTTHTAMSPAEVTEKLGLHRMRDRSWYVHPRYVEHEDFLRRRLIANNFQLCDDWRRSIRRATMALSKCEEATSTLISMNVTRMD